MTNKPSIAELAELDAKEDLTTDELLQIASATSVLLEITKAALAWQIDPLELLNHNRLVDALAKVRP